MCIWVCVKVEYSIFQWLFLGIQTFEHYIYIYIYVGQYTCEDIKINSHMYIYIYICDHTRTNINAHILTYMNIHVKHHLYTCINLYTNVCIGPYTTMQYTQIHIDLQKYANTHTHAYSMYLHA